MQTSMQTGNKKILNISIPQFSSVVKKKIFGILVQRSLLILDKNCVKCYIIYINVVSGNF